jgi:hypothetical protein
LGFYSHLLRLSPRIGAEMAYYLGIVPIALSLGSYVLGDRTEID